jgi:hypothetical protein
VNRHEIPIIQGSQAAGDTAKSRLEREAAIFSGIDNQKVRDSSWSAIPYFNQRILQEIDLRKETENALQGRSSITALTLACGDMTGEYAFLKNLGAVHIDAFDISEGQRDKFYKTHDRAISVDYRVCDVRVDMTSSTCSNHFIILKK